MSLNYISNPQRVVHSAGNFSSQFNNDDNRPHTTSVIQSKTNNVFWRDFMSNLKKRKAALQRLREAALESSTSLSVLKKALVDIRQDTLTLIEDALELEYRLHISESKSSSRRGKANKLPSLTSSYKKIEDKEDVIALSEIIYDVDDLCAIPNIRVMLPMNFPNTRNPFMLGKTIDELAIVVPPHPEAGNVDEELKVLELLRYKRAARALLRAESQVLNRLPIELFDVERLLSRMAEDMNVEKLARSICTIIDNDRIDYNGDMQPNLTCLNTPIFQIEGYELLKRLNNFQGALPMRVDVKIMIRQFLQGSMFDYLVDPVSRFLLEWIDIVLGSSKSATFPSGQESMEFNHPSIASTIHMSQNHGYSNTDNGENSIFPSSNSFQQFKQPFAIAKVDEDLASEVDSTKFVKTHENIQPIVQSKKKGTVKIVSPPRTPTKKVAQSTSPLSPSHSNAPESDKRETEKAVTTKRSRKDPKVTEIDSEMESINMKKKIRSEVEKAIRELALYSKPDKDDDVSGTKTSETLNSVRYELTKIQQELIRKQVLDPRFYTLNSVDSISLVQRGLTVPDINSFTPFDHSHQQKMNKKSITAADVSQPTEIASKTITIVYHETELPLLLSIVLHRETHWLYCSVSIPYEYSIKYSFQSEPKSYYAADAEKLPYTLFYLEISPLVFSLLTDYTSTELYNSKTDLRRRILQNIFDQLEMFSKTRPIPVGKLLLSADLSLYQQKLVEDNTCWK